MRNRLLSVLTVLVMAAFLVAGCQTVPIKTEPTIQGTKAAPALRDSATVTKGLVARSLDEVLTLADDQIDLATALLLISKRAYKDLEKIDIDIDIHRYRNRIDDMASALLTRIGKEKTPEGIIWAINHYLFDELKFSSFETKQDPNPAFLISVLDKRKGDCLGLSTLYLCIAERIGLKLFGAIVPNHAFVRYEDNVKRINIETTNRGERASDDYYIEWFKVPKASQFYLVSLGKKQMIGAFLNNVGVAYSSKGLYDQAISDYTKALEINPSSAEVYNNRGNVYGSKGLYDQAISDYTKALEINPRDARAYNNRGNVYGSKGLYDQAISDYSKVLEINPRSARAYNNRGNAYGSKGLYDQAISDYTKAIEINPKQESAYTNRGIAYAKKNQYDQAFSDFNSAIKLNPKDAGAYHNRGTVYRMRGQYDQAISDYNKALEIDPRYSSAWFNRGVAYYFKKEYDKSWENVTKAQELGLKIPAKFLDDLRKASGRQN